MRDPATVRVGREHRDSARKAAGILRRLNDLFDGATEWTLLADDLDEVADGYDQIMAQRAAAGQAWERRWQQIESGAQPPPAIRP